MTSKHVGIETARKTLGDLVTAAQQGTDIVLTRNGKPAARIVPYEGEPTMPATDTEHAHLVATVIAVAREDFIRSAKGRTAAGFDYGLGGGSEHAERSLQNGLYEVANRGHDTSNADECEARWRQLAVDLAADLDAFRAKCRGRKYTGWSMASSGPIRYAG